MATADATRLVTPIPQRTWNGTGWSPPLVTGQATVLVIPAPVRRWNGTTWEAFGRKHGTFVPSPVITTVITPTGVVTGPTVSPVTPYSHLYALPPSAVPVSGHPHLYSA